MTQTKPRADGDKTLLAGPAEARSRDTADALLWGTPYRTIKRVGPLDETETVLAEHVASGRQVIVKVFRIDLVRDLDTPEARAEKSDRLRLAVEVARKLQHPHVLRLLDDGRTPDGRPYLVTEVPPEGAILLQQELAERGRLPVGEAIAIAIDVLSALEAAHALGVVHRDVTPQTVRLAPSDAGTKRAVLGDFDLIKVVDTSKGGPAPLVKPTEEGARLGRPRYWSPEQVLGEPVQARSDLYQVGLLLYEMLSGKSPMDEWAGAALGDAHAHHAPPRLRDRVPEALPEGLEQAIHRAIAKKPADRFGSAADFAARLREIDAQAGIGTAPTELWSRPDLEALARLAGAPVTRGESPPAAPPRQERAHSPDQEPQAATPERERAHALDREARGASRPARLALAAVAAVALLAVLALWRWLG